MEEKKEKFTYGPLVYNFFGEEDDSGNYWWTGDPPVGYEEDSGVFRIPVCANGNQCLPGDTILHPNCSVEEWDECAVFGQKPSLSWCREWFEDNFLIIDDKTLCKYILRWMWWNKQSDQDWLTWSAGKTTPEMIEELWPDVTTS